MNIVDGEGLPDFVMCDKMDEDEFMKNLKLRFSKKLIYTYIGEQIVAMNPFTKVDIYGKERMQKYRNMELYEVEPHIYALADDTFRQLMRNKHDQCVLITGESGAGKTEASKIFMQYIVHVSGSRGDASSVKEHLLDSNPVLEAFGNAKTLRNDNSSRFGKYMEIQFDGSGAPMGGKISQYLLEKSRVVIRAEEERSFHIFYQLMSQSQLLGGLMLAADHSQYRCLALSKCYKVSGMNDSREFEEVSEAMTRLGFLDEDKQSVWRILAAILHTSNVDFTQGKECAEVSAGDLGTISKLLNMTEANLVRSMTENELKTAGKTTKVHLNQDQACFSRDSLCKALYTKVFDWVVDRINYSIDCEGKPEMVIGVLDIYGFEIFEQNSFEQFCINYCNEKLQQLFIRLVLEQEQAEYAREGIEWTKIDYFNNHPICDLIENKPNGIISVLDEACTIGKASPDELLVKLDKKFAKHPHYQSYMATKTKDVDRYSFRILHYAGTVDYNVTEFIFKNKDTLFKTIKQAFQSSSDPLMLALFPVDKAESRKRPVSSGTQFKKNVNQLITKLNNCQPHYIRCIKSNERKAAFLMNEERTRHQVRYLNLVETVRVRRAGFCNRQPYVRFVARYKMTCPDTWPAWNGDQQEGCRKILTFLGVDPAEYCLGKTKLFVKNAQTLTNLERCRDKEMHKVAKVIQSTWRKLHVKGKALRYMNELIRVFPKGQGNPNYGLASPVPGPSALPNLEGLSYVMMHRWWVVCSVLAMNPQAQATMRQESRIYHIFHGPGGGKPYTIGQKFLGDELATNGNAKVTAYNNAISQLLTTQHDKRVYFSGFVNKVNRKGKAQPRAFAVTEAHLYKLDPGKFSVKKTAIPLTSVLSIQLSPHADTFAVVQMAAPHRDLVLDLGAGPNQKDRLVEFVFFLHLLCGRVKGPDGMLAVEFSEKITFNNSRKEGSPGVDFTLTFAKNPKPEPLCVFKNMGGTQAQVLFPGGKRKCASQSCAKDAFKSNYCADHYNQYHPR